MTKSFPLYFGSSCARLWMPLSLRCVLLRPRVAVCITTYARLSFTSGIGLHLSGHLEQYHSQGYGSECNRRSAISICALPREHFKGVEHICWEVSDKGSYSWRSTRPEDRFFFILRTHALLFTCVSFHLSIQLVLSCDHFLCAV
jgi:hypothetical protein